MSNYFYKKRKAAGLTQKQVAAAAGKNHETVSAWERDIAFPRPELWPILAELFHITVADLESRRPIRSPRKRITSPPARCGRSGVSSTPQHVASTAGAKIS